MVDEYLRISDFYFKDSTDFLDRYGIMFDKWYGTKRGRAKCFVDLLHAYECILKSIIVYHVKKDTREESIKLAESYRHDIEKLENKAVEYFKSTIDLKSYYGEVNKPGVNLRYHLDISDFMRVYEKEYYKTIGCDKWLDDFAEYIQSIINWHDENLSGHTSIVSSSDIDFKDLLRKKQNKYSKKKD